MPILQRIKSIYKFLRRFFFEKKSKNILGIDFSISLEKDFESVYPNYNCLFLSGKYPLLLLDFFIDLLQIKTVFFGKRDDTLFFLLNKKVEVKRVYKNLLYPSICDKFMLCTMGAIIVEEYTSSGEAKKLYELVHSDFKMAQEDLEDVNSLLKVLSNLKITSQPYPFFPYKFNYSENSYILVVIDSKKYSYNDYLKLVTTVLYDAIVDNPKSQILLFSDIDILYNYPQPNNVIQLKFDNYLIVDFYPYVDTVYTDSSIFGFEALIRKKKVITYSESFYSGYGFTIDRYIPTTTKSKIDVLYFLYIVFFKYTTYSNNSIIIGNYNAVNRNIEYRTLLKYVYYDKLLNKNSYHKALVGEDWFSLLNHASTYNDKKYYRLFAIKLSRLFDKINNVEKNIIINLYFSGLLKNNFVKIISIDNLFFKDDFKKIPSIRLGLFSKRLVFGRILWEIKRISFYTFLKNKRVTLNKDYFDLAFFCYCSKNIAKIAQHAFYNNNIDLSLFIYKIMISLKLGDFQSNLYEIAKIQAIQGKKYDVYSDFLLSSHNVNLLKQDSSFIHYVTNLLGDYKLKNTLLNFFRFNTNKNQYLLGQFYLSSDEFFKKTDFLMKKRSPIISKQSNYILFCLSLYSKKYEMAYNYMDNIKFTKEYLKDAIDFFCWYGDINKIESLIDFIESKKMKLSPSLMMKLYLYFDYQKGFSLLQNLFIKKYLLEFYKDKYLDHQTKVSKGSIIIWIGYAPAETIRYISFIENIKELFNGCLVSFACDYRLVPLFEKCYPETFFVPVKLKNWLYGEPYYNDYNKLPYYKMHTFFDNHSWSKISSYDYVSHIGEFLHLFCKNKALLPRRPTFNSLKDTSDFIEKIKYKAKEKKIVGLCHRSSYTVFSRNHYYFDFEELVSLFDIDNTIFISLVSDGCEYEKTIIKKYGISNFFFCDLDIYNDFRVLSEFISSLDLVIGVNSTNTELAGFYNVPTFMISRGNSNKWRIKKHNNDVWFSSIKHFSEFDYLSLEDMITDVKTNINMMFSY